MRCHWLLLGVVLLLDAIDVTSYNGRRSSYRPVRGLYNATSSYGRGSSFNPSRSRYNARSSYGRISSSDTTVRGRHNPHNETNSTMAGPSKVRYSHNVLTLARANGNFAFRLYRKVIKGAAGENVFFCPFSISTALSMTYAGARGKTAKEMCLVLKFCPLPFNVHAIFRATLASLNSPQARYKLTMANGAFVNEKFTVLPSFTYALARYYSAGFKLLDFNDDPTGSARYINDWVKGTTDDKIHDLVNAMLLKGSQLVLVNAIYFKGDWMQRFDRAAPRPFHESNTQTKQVDMMSQTATFGYTVNHNLQCQILQLPFVGHRVAMVIFLPLKTEGLASLESKLTFQSVTSALANVRKQQLTVRIPKFKIDKKLDLISTLRRMGIKLAFTSAADFGGISAARPLFVKDVIHKAFISVSEAGTEAAAATAVIFRKSARLPVRTQFIADHPFLFLIRDQTTRSILFLGCYVK